MAKRIELKKLIAPSFFDLAYDIMEHRHTYYTLAGGRGSTKSSFAALMVVLLLMTHKDCHALVMRKVDKTIGRSVFPQIQWAVHALGQDAYFHMSVSPHQMTYLPTGQRIYFSGVDDPQKIKSIKPPFGYIGIVFLEELDQFAGPEEIRNINQSLLRGGPVFWEIGAYNPPKSQNSWVNEEALVEAPDKQFHHSTYLDVPRSWLGDVFFEAAETLKARNETAYRHEYLGEVTGTGGAVFENVRDVTFTDAQVEAFDHCYYGLDFGFAIDPMAFVAMHYDAKHEELYIFGEIYEQKLTNKRGAEKIKELLPHATAIIVADSAEPKSIAEMKEYGLRVTGARKGPDSVEYGIRWLQSLAGIYIDKRRAPNAFREFVGYEYERNRAGQFISAYPDANNHAIDAVRYGLQNAMRKSGMRIFK
ncbi:PBSX family phage terminase large subunit [uncultured Selenomonas sp.]|uniref:PBSX family phage terminase large subunit n=1 Tax=uncultured Selenomonas sp. TaxID=159275 RepID=UPI0025FDEE07|nr:PBSX family phage terminase large subunit [uncultured Selenomonas sp.]MDD6699178.1 PBSX family phage terminase large subunit [Veillonellaceae bacterium]